MKELLVIRLSAVGDVAMAVPVVDALARRYPDWRITVLTSKRCATLFEMLPDNVRPKGVAVGDYYGWPGLRRLYREACDVKYDAVADLHDVLRTKYLMWRFALARTRRAVIDKGRKQKKALLGHGLTAAPLKSTVQRYVDTLQRLGFDFPLDFVSIFAGKQPDMEPVWQVAGRKQAGDRWVGIAPFAAHEGKVYPLDKMARVAEMLAAKGCRVFVFGAGDEEQQRVAPWLRDGVESVIGRLGGLQNELLLMSVLDCMVSMDSANMHLASLVHTPVVSVWGATHPKAGFMGYGQSPDNALQLGTPCRPCSVYGNKICKYGDYRCLHDLPGEAIVNKVLSLVSTQPAHD